MEHFYISTLLILIANINYAILSFIESWTNPVTVVIVVVDVAVAVHIPNVVGIVRIARAKPEIATPDIQNSLSSITQNYIHFLYFVLYRTKRS